MSNIIGHIKLFLSTYWKDMLVFALNIVILGIMFTAISKCSHNNVQYKQNIVAFRDTIHHYETISHDTVYFKQGFSGEIEDLKILNKKLYDEIKDMKLQKKAETVIYAKTEYKRDTIYKQQSVIKYDTMSHNFTQDFKFNDDYRDLEGQVEVIDDTCCIEIDKDVVRFDYTLAIDKENKVYMKSDNPYVRPNELTSLTLPKRRNKHFSIGPGIQYNYDPINKNHAVGIGFSLHYNLLSF